MSKIFVFDPTQADKLSAKRGVGRYLQILKENFPEWNFINKFQVINSSFFPVFINPFFNFLQPPLIMKKIAQKQIAIIHDLIPLKYPSHFPAGVRGSLNIFLNKLALKNYDLIITDSYVSKKDIVEKLKIKSDKVKVIYPCLPKVFSRKHSVFSIKEKNKTNFFNTKDLILNTNYFLYIGDATWNKNLVNLAKAIKLADVSCVFVGKIFEQLSEKAKMPVLNFFKEPDEFGGGVPTKIQNKASSFLKLNHPWQYELKEFLKETKDDSRFIFPGFLTDEEIISLYQKAQANILISRDEGFGFSYLEASSQKCPSILSDIPVFQEISQKQALFVDPENPHEIASKIKKILTDEKLRDDLKEKAFQRSKFFSCEKFRNQFLKLI